MQLLTKNGIKIETVTATDHTISGLNYSVLMGEVNRHRQKTFSKLNHLNVKRNSGFICMISVFKKETKKGLKQQICMYQSI